MASMKITICGGVEVTLTSDSDGRISADKVTLDGRWFTLHQECDGKFYLQENLEETAPDVDTIIDLGVYNTLVEGLQHLASAERLRINTYFRN